MPDEPAVGFAGMPLALKILWTIWASVVAINLTVWLLVGVGGAELTYFWPIWLAVPGVVLARRHGRRHRRPHAPPGGSREVTCGQSSSAPPT